jgi:hypothetical protein
MAAVVFSATANEDWPDNEIYSSVINHGLDSHAEIVVITEKTSGSISELGPNDEVEKIVEVLGIEKETYMSWRKRNRERVNFNSVLKLTVPYVLLPEKTQELIFDKPDLKTAWLEFSDTYSGARNLLRFSRIGYNYKITNALVYVEHLCGVECSSGRFIALKLMDNRWVVQGSNLIWVAY